MSTISLTEQGTLAPANNCEPQQPKPSRKVKLAVKARSRAVKVNLASRGRLPVAVPAEHLDDDVLLDDVTRAAREATLSEQTLAQAVTACCHAEVDRDEVIEAVIAGGWSSSRAKTLISAVYCAAGKRVRAKGAGRETPKAALAFADYILDKTESRAAAIKMARAALRYLVALEKKANEVKAHAPVAKTPELKVA